MAPVLGLWVDIRLHLASMGWALGTAALVSAQCKADMVPRRGACSLEGHCGGKRKIEELRTLTADVDGSMVHEYAAKKDGTRGEVTKGGGRHLGTWDGERLTKEPSRLGGGLGRFSKGKRPRIKLNQA